MAPHQRYGRAARVAGKVLVALGALAAAAAPTACTRTSDFVGYACGLPPPLPGVASDPWTCGLRCFVDENLKGLPGGPEPFFERPVDPSPTAQPTFVYPLPGSVHPLNLGGLTLQWRRGAGGNQQYFRVRVTPVAAPLRQATLYLPCQPPPPIPAPPAIEECKYELSRALWTAIAAENPDGAVDLTIDGIDQAGTTLAPSPPLRISFAPSSVRGGIYYWSSERQGVFRAVLGGGAGQPFLSPPVDTRFSCAGCHSVSHDGRVMAFSAQRDAYAQAGTLSAIAVAAPQPPLIPPATGLGGDGATMAVNRDGSLVLVSFGTTGDAGRLVVRRTAGGGEVARLDPASLPGGDGRLFFPDWSPGGRELVATLGTAASAVTPWSVVGGSIVVLPFAGDHFDGARVVVPQDDAGGLFHYYPTFSPDGAWIAFVSAPLPGPSYGNAQSRLRLVARTGGRVYDLNNATQAIGKTSTYPRFAPVMQDQCNVLYLTFNSKLDYGFLGKNSQLLAAGGRGSAQLWMSAVDLRALGSGDPSRPPVWLPFQQVAQTNLLGSWTQRVVCSDQAACGPATEATCDTALGECVPTPP